MWEPVRDLTDVLSTLPMPVLLVWATDDPVSPLGVGRHLEGLIPRARLLVLESDDHWVARLHPEEVAREVTSLDAPVVGFLHTRGAHVATFDALLDGSGARAVHHVDEDLLATARTDGVDDPAVVGGVQHHLDVLHAAGADVIVCTCSTIGAVAEASPCEVPSCASTVRWPLPRSRPRGASQSSAR